MKRILYGVSALTLCLTISVLICGASDVKSPSRILVLKTWVPPAIEGVRKCPVCGAMLPAQSDREEEGATLLDVLLNRRLSGISSCDFIYPDPDEEILFSFAQPAHQEKLKELAGKYEAQAVLYPVLLRFRERVGNKYAVSSPSAAAFHIYLLNAENLEVLWRAYYIEEQQPLSSNLLKIGLMWKRKFQWVKADKLLEDGLEHAFKKFPACGGKLR